MKLSTPGLMIWNTDPIQATPEQLKLAKQLADSVNGELVFYDKDLNLGLVTVANKLGFDDYFPIHDGIISKVDVSDYTGLSVMDKSFLKRIKNSLEGFQDTKPGLDDASINVEFRYAWGPSKGSLWQHL
jgi:hypothetical protein